MAQGSGGCAQQSVAAARGVRAFGVSAWRADLTIPRSTVHALEAVCLEALEA
jgi:hypothetical protein